MSRIVMGVWGLAAVFAVAAPCSAQTYLFAVPRMTVEVQPTMDGGAQIEYWITFENSATTDPIDVVDVGLPNGRYDISAMSADCDGVNLTDIRKSEFIDIGVEVHLGSAAIQPGDTGLFHFTGTCERMVWVDTQSETDASIEFAPTFFDDSCVQGLTDLAVRMVLPPGTNAENVRHHAIPFTHSEVVDDRVEYTWLMEGISIGTQPPVVGASFPAELVDVVHRKGAGDKLADFLASIITGAMCVCPGLICIAAVVIGARASRRRRMAYMPPSLKAETAGVNRGLDPVEAALVCETPLDRVTAMLALSLMRRGVLRCMRTDPLRYEVLQNDEVKLRPYEQAFLACVQPDGSLGESELARVFEDLIEATSTKMRGYHRAQTQRYYREYVGRAWSDLEHASDATIQTEAFGSRIEWTMIDNDFDSRFERTFSNRAITAPYWWGYASPDHWGARDTVRGRHINDFVPTFRGMHRRTIADGRKLTEKVTAKTHPVPVHTSSGRGGGGGSSCACACACAGCACACAGGGR